jgi:outer membrane lipoprotein SlyB
MRKIVTKVLFTLAMAVSFYGCGDGDSSSGRIVAIIEDKLVQHIHTKVLYT